MDFTLYRSDFAGVEANCRYPRQQKISCAEDLKAAAAFDHVCVAFKDCYRKRENFLSADVLVMDCDNTRRILLTGFPWKISWPCCRKSRWPSCHQGIT